jgi:hypothetical protein
MRRRGEASEIRRGGGGLRVRGVGVAGGERRESQFPAARISSGLGLKGQRCCSWASYFGVVTFKLFILPEPQITLEKNFKLFFILFGNGYGLQIIDLAHLFFLGQLNPRDYFKYL